MQSFKNNTALKQKYIDRAKHHQEQDEIIQGSYWDGKNGCCVGCLAHKSENAHEALQKQINVPVWLSRVADTIHEGLEKEKSKAWPLQFIQAIPVGISEETFEKRVKAPFLIIVLKSVLETFDHDKFPDVKAAIESSITLWQRDDIGSVEFLEAAQAAAWAARAAAQAAWEARAARAAAQAAWATWEAEAAWATWAAQAAAWAARAAAQAAWEARAAAWAARAAAQAAWEAEAAWARAAEAVEAAKYEYFANELLKLLNALNDKVK